MLNDGHHEYIGQESVPPGCTGLASIWLLAPELQNSRLYPGFAFTVQEGARIVGRGVVTRVFNAELKNAA